MESEKKNGSEEPRGRTGINRRCREWPEDTGSGKGKLGRSERVGWTYTHCQR